MTKISKQQELNQLRAMSDQDIDTSDIPETNNWNKAQTGKFYRPIKKQVTLRLDADTLDWFKHQGNKYQTRINDILRQYMNEHQKI